MKRGFVKSVTVEPPPPPFLGSQRIISLQLKLGRTFSAPKIYHFRSHWKSDFAFGLATAAEAKKGSYDCRKQEMREWR